MPRNPIARGGYLRYPVPHQPDKASHTRKGGNQEPLLTRDSRVFDDSRPVSSFRAGQTAILAAPRSPLGPATPLLVVKDPSCDIGWEQGKSWRTRDTNAWNHLTRMSSARRYAATATPSFRFSSVTRARSARQEGPPAETYPLTIPSACVSFRFERSRVAYRGSYPGRTRRPTPRLRKN